MLNYLLSDEKDSVYKKTRLKNFRKQRLIKT